MGVNGPSSEDNDVTSENWETIDMAPGAVRTPITQLEFDRDSGAVQRKDGYESVKIVIHPPERPL